jgi:hypothetical protein
MIHMRSPKGGLEDVTCDVLRSYHGATDHGGHPLSLDAVAVVTLLRL